MSRHGGCSSLPKFQPHGCLMASVGGNLRRRKGRSLRQRAETTGQDHHSPKNAKPRLGKAGLDVWLDDGCQNDETYEEQPSRSTTQASRCGLHDLLSVSKPRSNHVADRTGTRRPLPSIVRTSHPAAGPTPPAGGMLPRSSQSRQVNCCLKKKAKYLMARSMDSQTLIIQ